MSTTLRTAFLIVGLVAVTLTGMGAKGDRGCGASDPDEPVAPDLSGGWDVSYDDTLAVTVKIGGSTYTEELGAAGGEITINHDGHPFTFDLDCSRPEVLCPSEVWPATVELEQPDELRTQNVRVTLPSQECDGELIDPDPAECGPDTTNPDCEQVCDGEVILKQAIRPGLVTKNGSKLSILLGIGAATNGINCVLLGVSAAEANISSTGEPQTLDWYATGLDDGKVKVGYAGGCLWAGDPDDDGSLEALVLGASIVFETGFVADRQ